VAGQRLAQLEVLGAVRVEVGAERDDDVDLRPRFCNRAKQIVYKGFALELIATERKQFLELVYHEHQVRCICWHQSLEGEQQAARLTAEVGEQGYGGDRRACLAGERGRERHQWMRSRRDDIALDPWVALLQRGDDARSNEG